MMTDSLSESPIFDQRRRDVVVVALRLSNVAAGVAHADRPGVFKANAPV